MTIIEILLGCVTIAGAGALSAGVLFSKDEGRGLSAAIGGTGREMQNERKGHNGVIDKIVMASGVLCAVGTVALGIIAAHM